MHYIRSSLFALVLCGLVTTGFAETLTVTAPVEADTYCLHSHGINNGYPDSHVARATSWVSAESLFRFDLSGLEGVQAEQILSATFKVFIGEGSGSMATPVAPAGVNQSAQITALRTWDPEVHPYALEYWTEAGLGNYPAGYIDGAHIADNLYDPGDVGGVDPYEYAGEGLAEIEGELNAIMSHSTGPNTWASVDLTAFVQAWLPGGESDVANNGIRIHDLNDDWGWYFFTKDVGGSGAYGLPAHPGETYIPYLEVTYSSTIPDERIPGDANKDGVVDGSDVTILAGNWQYGADMEEPNAAWEMGDFNGDGMVDGSDVTILAGNWQYGTSTSSAVVPEPTTWAMLAGVVGSLLLCPCNRRQRKISRKKLAASTFSSDTTVR